jgi:16S rRNA (cytosine967-C5)-methyltransferase
MGWVSTARNLITGYNGSLPFAVYLKNYYAANKRHGSSDRRNITMLCYAYYRTGHVPIEELTKKILTGVFLTEQVQTELMADLAEDFNEIVSMPLQEKIKHIKFPVKEIITFKNELSSGVDFNAYSESFLQQPKLFLRLRPHKQKAVVKKLQLKRIPLVLMGDNCIALNNAVKLDEILEVDREVVIQDYTSQQVLNFLKTYAFNKKNISIWDCCTASGGKSIWLYDYFIHKINLTVCDIRPTILFNLHQRFAKAGIKNYNYFIADVSQPNFTFPDLGYRGLYSKEPTTLFDIVVCDVPCTGSGTWARTPENAYHFKSETIDAFTKKQQAIVTNAANFLNANGLLFYITCSVFKKENEDAVTYIQNNTKLKLLHSELLTGYHIKADSMFVAVFTKH